jgi:RNA polymerase sigma-70 factor (ECF subfamily)
MRRRELPVALVDVPVELIESCRSGDQESVEELIRQISPDLYRIIFSILRDHDETDEVLQETLIRLFRYVGSLKDVNRFPAWVMRIATNQVQTFRAKRGRSRLYEMEDTSEISNSAVVLGGSPPPDARGKLMGEEIREEISAAMDTLPTRQRMATVLFEVEGLSIKEIAQALECSEGAVKFNIHEGRKKLKKQLAHLVREKRWGRAHFESAQDDSKANNTNASDSNEGL